MSLVLIPISGITSCGHWGGGTCPHPWFTQHL